MGRPSVPGASRDLTGSPDAQVYAWFGVPEARPAPPGPAQNVILLSLLILAVTAAVQASVVLLSGSVALLGDTLHNVADALTAVPLLIAFRLARRPATKRYAYGYGRAEDLGGPPQALYWRTV